MRPLLRFALASACLCLASGVAGAGADTTTSTSVPSSTTSAPTTTVSVLPVAPLTGMPDPSGVTRHRSALTIKIDNTPEAHPQSGIDKADVVVEEIVEGDITRLAAIFNSRLPTVVGPVRSVRRTDREIVTYLGGIFAFSGGASYAIKSIETAPVKLFDEANSGSAMFRSATRPAPHNLYANAVALMAKGGRPQPPPSLFTYRSGGTTVAGPRIASFVVGFGAGYQVTYAWDAKTHSWDRSLFGEPDRTTDGARLSPANVIVMFVHYRGGVGVEGSEAVLTGVGPAEIFTDGVMVRGTWRRDSLRHPIVYKSSSGRIIALTPGQTWVELLDVSMHVTTTPAT